VDDRRYPDGRIEKSSKRDGEGMQLEAMQSRGGEECVVFSLD